VKGLFVLSEVDMAAQEPSGTSEAAARRASQQDIVVEALAWGRSYAASAEAAGITPKTVGRWMDSHKFAQRVAQRREEATTRIVGRLSSLGSDALDALERELHHGQRSADRIRTAALILSQLSRFRHSEDLNLRLHEIEERVGLRAQPNDTEPKDHDEGAKSS
jgi:hypothetical protein